MTGDNTNESRGSFRFEAAKHFKLSKEEAVDSTVLFFEPDAQIDAWAKRQNIARGMRPVASGLILLTFL